MRCDGCRHWVETEQWEARNAGLRECKGVRERWVIEDEAVKDIPKYPNDEPLVEADWDEVGERWMQAHNAAFQREMAFIQDGSQYMAELYTTRDFFCAKYASNT